MAHSVESHLRLDVKEYDRLIRTFSPRYDEMLGVVADTLANLFANSFHVIDLGTGTGALAYAVAERNPLATIEVWDVDVKMLEIAKTRLLKFGDRVTVVEGTFESTLPHCDAVVASFSLHHLKERAKKNIVFSNIYKSLRTGGVFLNADQTVSDQPTLERLTYKVWANFMSTQGWSEAEAMAHFADWSNEDKYFPLFEELNALATAGFHQPECFWKIAAATVYGGIKI